MACAWATQNGCGAGRRGGGGGPEAGWSEGSGGSKLHGPRCTCSARNHPSCSQPALKCQCVCTQRARHACRQSTAPSHLERRVGEGARQLLIGVVLQVQNGFEPLERLSRRLLHQVALLHGAVVAAASSCKMCRAAAGWAAGDGGGRTGTGGCRMQAIWKACDMCIAASGRRCLCAGPV